MLNVVKRLRGLRPSQRALVSITLTAMLAALYFVLDRFLTVYPLPSVKIGFAFLPVAAAAILLGPVPAALVGALGDLIGSVLFPAVGAAPMPLLTLSRAAEGLVLGLLLYEAADRQPRSRRARWTRLGIALAITTLALHLAFDTFALALLFSPDAIGAYMLTLLPWRALKEGILLVLQVVVYAVLMKLALPAPKE